MKNMRQVKRRNDQHVVRQVTEIWEEQPCPDNPYISDACRCHGYDLLELMKKRSFIDVLFLLFQSELPTEPQAKLLESLMIGLINPGPRHPATRAAMAAGVGKTDPALILPISLNILSGSHLGAGCIVEGMNFFHEHGNNSPQLIAQETIANNTPPKEGDWHPAPGFGSRFGGRDLIPHKIAKQLCCQSGAGAALHWGEEFAASLHPHGLGWLVTGVAAAVFSDLGFQPRVGPGLFQLLSAPGLLAHGLELADKPFSSMPFPADKDYLIEDYDG